jgi:hypothetical protein
LKSKADLVPSGLRACKPLWQAAQVSGLGSRLSLALWLIRAEEWQSSQLSPAVDRWRRCENRGDPGSAASSALGGGTGTMAPAAAHNPARAVILTALRIMKPVGADFSPAPSDQVSFLQG